MSVLICGPSGSQPKPHQCGEPQGAYFDQWEWRNTHRQARCPECCRYYFAGRKP